MGCSLLDSVRSKLSAEATCFKEAETACRSWRDRIIKIVVVRPRAILIVTALAALVVFAVVQDRVTAAGARRYVALQRDAIAGRGHAVTVDEIMRPAIARSVRLGLMWAGVVVVSGVAIAAAVATRRTTEQS
jgi:hypothetical protein